MAIAILVALLFLLLTLLALKVLSTSSRPLNEVVSTSPTDTSFGSVVNIYLNLLLKQLSFLSKPLRLSNRSGVDYEFPGISIEAPLRITKSQYHGYKSAVCPLLLRGRKPADVSDDEPISPLALPAFTTPLILQVLSHPANPIAPIGALNVSNTFEILQPEKIATLRQLTGKTWTAKARLGTDGRRAKRGVEWDIVVEVFEKDVNRNGAPVARTTFTALTFLSRSAKPAYVGKEKSATELFKTDAFDYKCLGVIFKTDTTSPLPWSRVTLDYNPIHVSPFLGKFVFGLGGSIAHGNLMVAAFLEGLKERPELRQFRDLCWSDKPSIIKVDFRRPMVLPARFVGFGSSVGKDGATFDIRTEQQEVCVAAQVRLLAPPRPE